MFAPEGYVTWAIFRDTISYWSGMIAAAKCASLQSAGEAPGQTELNWCPMHEMVDAEIAKSHTEALSILTIYDLWCTAIFLFQHPPHMCSPEGKVLQAPRTLVTHADQLWLTYWEWKIEDSPIKSFLSIPQHEHTLLNSLGYRFPCFDFGSGTVSLKNNSKEMLRQGNSGMFEGSATDKLIAHTVKPFEGWALCWPSEDFPSEWTQILELFEANPLLPLLNETSEIPKCQPLGGRPTHPAKEWYFARKCDREGRSLNELQRLMPRDGKHNPPAISTIRAWEKEFSST